MTKMIECKWFKVICIFLIASFICMDIVWAYPAEHNAVNSTLSLPTSFQQRQVDSFLGSFRSRASLVLSMGDIGDYVFGESDHGIKPLPIDKLETAMMAPVSGLSDALKDLKLEGLCAIIEEAGQLRALKPAESVPNNAIIAILCEDEIQNKKLILIAFKGNALSQSLPGEVLGETDRYMVKIVRKVPETKSADAAPVETAAMAVIRPETPVAEPAIEETKAKLYPEAVRQMQSETAQTPGQPVVAGVSSSIKKIATAIVITLAPLTLFAADSSTGQQGAGTILNGLSRFTAAHPVFTTLAMLAGLYFGMLIVMLVKDYYRDKIYRSMYNKAGSRNTKDILKAVRFGYPDILKRARDNIRTIKGVDVLANFSSPSSLPIEVLARFREIVNTSEEAEALRMIIDRLKIEKQVAGQEPIMSSAVLYKGGSRGSDADWEETSEIVGYIDTVRAAADYSKIIVLAENPEELRRLIDEELAKQTRPAAADNTSKITHDFTAVSGFMAAGVTGIISLAGFATGVIQYAMQGDFTGVTLAAVLAGAYFAWATVIYFRMGQSAYKALLGSGVSTSDALNTAIARNDGYRHPAFKEQKFITMHEGFVTHLGGMLGVLPIISWFFTDRYAKSLRKAEMYAKATSDDPEALFEAATSGLRGGVREVAISNISKMNDIKKITRLLGIPGLSYYGEIKESLFKALLNINTPEALNELRRAIAGSLKVVHKEAEVDEEYENESVPPNIGFVLCSHIVCMDDIQIVSKIVNNYVSLVRVEAGTRFIDGDEDYPETCGGSDAVDLRNSLLGVGPGKVQIEVPKYKISYDFLKLETLCKDKIRLARIFIKEKIEIRTYNNGNAIGAPMETRMPENEYEQMIDKFVSLTMKFGIDEALLYMNEILQVEYVARVDKEAIIEEREAERNYKENILVWVEVSPAVHEPMRFKIMVDMEKLNILLGEAHPATITELPATTEAMDATKSDKVGQLFQIVEEACNNNRAAMEAEANSILAAVAFSEDLEGKVDTAKIDRAQTTLEVREKIEDVIRAIESKGTANVPEDISAKADSLKRNLDRLEADSIVGSTIALARSAKRDGQKFFLGIETGWINEVDRKNREDGSRPDGTSSLMEEIYSLGLALRSMGLDNVEIVTQPRGADLLRVLNEKREKADTKWLNVIVLASKETLEDETIGFKTLSESPGKDKPFLAGFDLAEFRKWTNAPRRQGERLDIQMMKFVCLTLELASGKKDPNNPIIISYDESRRMVIYMPGAEVFEYEMLRDMNNGRAAALRAA